LAAAIQLGIETLLCYAVHASLQDPSSTCPKPSDWATPLVEEPTNFAAYEKILAGFEEQRAGVFSDDPFLSWRTCLVASRHVTIRCLPHLPSLLPHRIRNDGLASDFAVDLP